MELHGCATGYIFPCLWLLLLEGLTFCVAHPFMPAPALLL